MDIVLYFGRLLMTFFTVPLYLSTVFSQLELLEDSLGLTTPKPLRHSLLFLVCACRKSQAPNLAALL